MKRYKQTYNEIADSLQVLEVDWMSDPHADPVISQFKSFNATGSKQTDALGDIYRLLEQRRDDTAFMLVTDGISWKARQSDLRKIVKFQNEGKIRRIYPKAMTHELEADLRSLAGAFGEWG